MTNSLQATEDMCAALATAPRVSKAMIEGEIVAVRFATGEQAFGFGTVGQPTESLRLMTLCAIVLRNGFVVLGESSCASPENYVPQVGRDAAYENAFRKIWPLMGFELRSKLAAAGKAS